MPSNPGLLARATRRCAAASARFPKTVILLWLVLVAGILIDATLARGIAFPRQSPCLVNEA